jgi:hypothetical protein
MKLTAALAVCVCALFILPCARGSSSANLMANPELSVGGGSSNAPGQWQAWNDGNGDPEYAAYRSAPNSWAMWWDSGIYQDVTAGYHAGDVLRACGYLYTPSWDKLSGSVTGALVMEVWSGATLLTNVVCQPTIGAGTASNTWIYTKAEHRLSTNASAVRIVARFNPNGGGSGRFFVDDISVTNPQERANYVPHPSFEMSGGVLPGWTQYGASLQGPEYSIVRSGGNSWMLSGTARVEQVVSYPIQKGQKIRFGAHLWRNPTSSPSSTVYLNIGGTLYATPLFYWASPSNRWVAIQSTITAPITTNYFTIRVQNTYQPGLADDIFVDILDTGANLMINPLMSGSGKAPGGWSEWNESSHDPDSGTFRSAANGWGFWWDGGLYEDVTANLIPGFTLAFGAHVLNPSWDPLRNGAKRGVVNLEVYGGTNLLGAYAPTTSIHSASPQDTWVKAESSVIVPTNVTAVRLLIRSMDWASGDGRFLADDAMIGYRSTLVDGQVNPSMYGTALIVQSNPAVAYWEYIQTYTGRLKFARNTSPEGTGSWSTVTLLQTNVYVWGAPFPSLQLVAGIPAMAVRHYPGNGDLYYFRSSSADGSGTWTSALVEAGASGENCGVDPTLLVVGGLPAISSLTDGGGAVSRQIRYYTCATSNGLGAWTGRTLASGYAMANSRTTIGNMEIVNGRPALVWMNDQNGSATLSFLYSTNTAGNGSWTSSVIQTGLADPGRPHLAIVGGRPAVAYNAGRNLRYAINANAAGTGTWTVVTVATNVDVGTYVTLSYTPKLSIHNGKPAIAYTMANGDYPAVAYAMSSVALGTSGWTTRRLAPGSYVGSSIQHLGRPLVVHHGVLGDLRVTR